MSENGEPPDADAEMVAGNEPPSARQPLDRERIVAAAITFIEESGLASLSMRRLGAALGVEAMSLYRYVPGRENLLDAVVETIMDEMRVDPETLPEPRDGWQDFLQRLAHGVRRVALAHPRAFPLVASRPVEAPWLRPPLRSLTWVEAFLDGLITEGFSDEAAVGGLPRLHQLPARPSPPRGGHARRGRRSPRRARRRRDPQREAADPSHG